MFSKVILDNFKSFDHFELDLVQNKSNKKAKKLAVIYGENAVGKSSVVDAFRLLKKLKRSIVESKLTASFQVKGLLTGTFLDKLMINDDLMFSADEYVPLFKKIGSSGNMALCFEGFLDDQNFTYKVSFDSSSIVSEKLFINGETAFGTDRYGRAYLSNNFFSSSMLINEISQHFKMYFGKHSLLACISSFIMNADRSFVKDNISKTILMFLDELENLNAFKEQKSTVFMMNSNSKLLTSLVYGVYSDVLKEKLEKTKTALTMFFTSLYSNIKYVDYDIEITPDNNRNYCLVFVEGDNENESRVPYSLASTGTKKLLELFPIFFEVVANDGVAVIDEIDSGINDILLKEIFTNLSEDIKGQLIVTTHNTLLLNSINKKYIYLMDREDDKVISYSLDSFGRKIQSGTNVINQYLSGLYGGIPQAGSFSMKYIVEEAK